eukprot:365554-Chlamydomonas_euryale.AAC.9
MWGPHARRSSATHTCRTSSTQSRGSCPSTRTACCSRALARMAARTASGTQQTTCCTATLPGTARCSCRRCTPTARCRCPTPRTSPSAVEFMSGSSSTRDVPFHARGLVAPAARNCCTTVPRLRAL